MEQAPNKLIPSYLRQSEQLMKDKMSELAKIIAAIKTSGTATAHGKKLVANKKLLKEIEKQYAELTETLNAYLSGRISDQWDFANIKNDDLTTEFVGANAGAKYLKRNKKDLNEFLEKSVFRSKIYELTEDSKTLLTDYIRTGITQGRSSISIARDLNKVNSNPYGVTVLDGNGEKTTLGKVSRFLRDYKAQPGQYKKPLSNLFRLVRTETNRSYRTSDFVRIQQLDFVVGVKVNLSASHPVYDICDDMAGLYPKGFVFTGWHPNCYHKDVEVMTDWGWKYFYDLDFSDKIFSLNPVNRVPEYVGIVGKFKRFYDGKLIHFNNKYLSIPVTPDHDMVYLNKSDGRFVKKKAENYSQFNGGIYRSSEYIAKETSKIKIGIYELDFNIFCEFMGYYLSDGCIVQDRNRVCTISQQKENDPETYSKIKNCLNEMPFKFTERLDGFHFHDQSFYDYLSQFGKSFDKYIPTEILNSSTNQIQIFLDAFISCDGHIRKPKSFIGNHGNVFKSKNNERTYFTTSPQMMSDIGECIVKIGKRPGFKCDNNKGKITKFKNGEYTANYDHWRISECKSKTATQFNKDEIKYSDFVYDIELDKNHIMYLRHNGKPFWGHNCICYTTTVLKTKEEFRNDSTGSSRTVSDIPQRSKDYIKTMPDYWKKADWYQDNF